MSNTLVIHLDDRSTDFLKLVYKGKDFDVINDGNTKDEELVEQIKSHDKIIMMGHGLHCGLINVNTGPNNYNLFFINRSHADLLRTKETISIWCFSNEFFKMHSIPGFHTGMIISETSEEQMVLGYVPLNKEELLKNMEFMATKFNECIDMDADGIKQYMLDNYVGNDDVTKFNRENMIVL